MTPPQSSESPARGPRTVHLVSLGCPKNRVDSEIMLAGLMGGGIAPVEDPAEAELILVNTCGFLQQAVEESIDTVLDMARFKHEGRCTRLVVTGCMVQSHAKELADELPEVDAFLGLGELQDALAAARGEGPRLRVAGAVRLYDHQSARALSLRGGAAYLKIAEGCNRSCSFCRIPAIRGPQQSRSVDSVVAEARGLAEQGIVEVSLVAQDLTAYGREPGGPGARLPELLDRLVEIDGLRWIRLLYLYPQGIDDALLDRIAGQPKILPYVDLPLQHVADPVLRAMRRGHDKAQLLRLMERLEQRLPDRVLRSTFIVGFPGETEAQFEELMTFVREARPARVAVFRFSPEPGTAAADLPDPVPRKEATRRYNALTRLASSLAKEHNRKLVGTVQDVLVEGPSEESEYLWQGRVAGQGPEDMDGVTYLPAGLLPPGTIAPLRIREAHPLDLVAEPLDAEDD